MKERRSPPHSRFIRGMLENSNEVRQQRNDDFCVPIRNIQIRGHAFWPHECPINVPANKGQKLLCGLSLARAYLNEVVIFSSDMTGNVQHLRTVL